MDEPKASRAIVLVVVLVGMQLIPVERSNPPVTGPIDAPAVVKELLARSCGDCHSNETVWPWYSRLAPASWIVTRDVRKGREELDFSEWADYSQRRRNRKFEEIEEYVDNRKMPLPIYLSLHADARLADSDRQTIVDWARSRQTTEEPDGD